MAAATQTAKGRHGQTSSRELKDPAATAALYVTTHGKSGARTTHLLDGDGKLSSASAALSLKHAQPRDLPSFPVVGVANPESSAGAAASLAHANQTNFEHWKPDTLPSANKAALLAKDYKAEPLWEPELSSAGSKAALLAHRKGANVEPWQSSATAEGNSAAGHAMRKRGPPATAAGPAAGPSAPRKGLEKETADGALNAASGAFTGERYTKPFPPVPELFPDARNSAANALNAATKAHRPRKTVSVPNDLPGMSAEDARRIHAAAVTNLSREMYTAAPPVAPEVEERNRQAGLNAAAISMAKQMYESQQKRSAADAAARTAATTSSGAGARRKSQSEADDLRGAAQRYLHLQDAARKLASERLAKLNDENAAYKSYYGQQTPVARRGISLRSRRRSGSSGDEELADPTRAQKIRSEMSGLTSKLQAVDTAKRRNDREALLEAARRNVRQSMVGMDERVFAETGKASAAMQAEWEERARAQAKERSSQRLENHGKVDIGGGKFIDQAEIDAIAAARVQPTLDQITAKAERDRARDEANRRAEEQRKAHLAEKDRQERERKRNTDSEWKKFKADEKAERKRLKDEQKARRAEEKKAQKERDEEAKVAAMREKERLKEEKAEAKHEQEEKRKSEKEHDAKLAAELEAIKQEEKRRSREQKQQQKEEKAAEKEREKEEAAIEKEIHKQEKEEEKEAKALEKEREAEEKAVEKQHEEETRAAQEEEEERDEAGQRVHEIALKVRQEARAAAVMQYLQAEQDKVHAEEEHKREEQKKHEMEEKEREKEQREWEEKARQEEIEKVEREIDVAKADETKKRETEKTDGREQREGEEHARQEEQEKVERETAEAKGEELARHERQKQQQDKERKDAEKKKLAEAQAAKDDKKAKLFKRRSSTDKAAEGSSSRRGSLLFRGSKDDRDEDKSKRRSRTLGLGAVAAAIGLGTDRDKKHHQASAAPQPADSNASTSLESLSSDEPTRRPERPADKPVDAAADTATTATTAAAATAAAATAPAATAPAATVPATATQPVASAPTPKQRMAPPISSSSQPALSRATTTTTVEAGDPAATGPTTTIEAPPLPAKEKRASWFKRFSRRASKPDNKPEKLSKSRGAREDGASSKQRTIEPVTGLPVDRSKQHAGFGTDNIPHVGEHAPDKTRAPATAAATAVGGGLLLQPSVTAASTSTAATAPSQASASAPAAGGHPAISAPIHTRPIQNSAGFSAEPAAVQVAAAVKAGKHTSALQPGDQPQQDQADMLTPPGLLEQQPRNDSARDVALARPDEDGESTDLASSDEERAEALRDEPAVMYGSVQERGRQGNGFGNGHGNDLGNGLGKEPGHGNGNGNGDTTTTEDEFQEAHDRFDTDDLPLPIIRSVAEASGSPNRVTKFREEL